MTDASLRRTRRSETVVPDAVLERFGTRSARPRIVQVYSPQRGWRTDRVRELVTVDLLNVLKASGVTRVEARWRRKVERINLLAIPLG